MFQFVTSAGANHELVIYSSSASAAAIAGVASGSGIATTRAHPKAHNIDRIGWHPPQQSRNACFDAAAHFPPGLTRRFPFSAVV